MTLTARSEVLRLQALGRLRLDGETTGLGSPRKSLALLTYLCRKPDLRARREELMALFWGERPEPRARQSLRQVVLELRQVLGTALEAGPETIALTPARIQLDVNEFESEVAAGRFEHAVALWNGDFLADADDAGGEPYRIWIEGEREGLKRKFAGALSRLIDEAASRAAWPEAVAWAEKLEQTLPYDESAHCRLLDTLDHAGRRDEAVARHAAFLVRLRREVDLAPSAELLQLGQRLSEPVSVEAAAAAVPAASVLTHAEAVDVLAAMWQDAQAGGSAAVFLAGASASECANVIGAFLKRNGLNAGHAVTLRTRAGPARPWRAAQQLLAPLRHAPGLSGAPDTALAELSVLVPAIRERFPKLPAVSGEAQDLAAGVAQVLADVASEVPVAVLIENADAVDEPSRLLFDQLAQRRMPGVLYVLAAEPDGAVATMSSTFGMRRLTIRSAASPSRVRRWPARLRRAHLAGALAVPLMLATAFAALYTQPKATAPTGARLAVLPFTVHGSSGFEYLREGMVELLGTSLDGSAPWKSVDARTVLRKAGSVTGVLDPQRARAVADKLGAEFYVLGSITESGRTLRVQAMLYRRLDERPLVVATASASADNLFTLVDALAEQMLSHFDSRPGARLSRIAGLTTDSLTALKAYLEGEALLRNFAVRDAYDAFQRAVSVDSTFALAWYRQATVASWMLAPDVAMRAAERAVRHAGRLSPRDRTLAELLRAFLAGNADEAERLGRLVLAYYPDDVEYRMQLAEVLFHFAWRSGRSFTAAEPELRRVLRDDPDHGPAMVHLAQIAMHQGRHATVDSLTATLLAEYGEHPTAAWIGALRDGASHAAAFENSLRRLQHAGDWWLTLGLWDLATYASDPAAADRAALLLADAGGTPAARAIGLLARAHLELARGRWQNAQAELAQLRYVNPEWSLMYSSLLSAAWFLPTSPALYRSMRDRLTQWNPDTSTVRARAADPRPWITVHDGVKDPIRLYLIGLLDLRLGDFEGVAKQASLLQAQATGAEETALAAGLVGSLRAQVLRLQGKTQEALTVLEATAVDAPFEYTIASPFWSQALERFMRAELLADLARYDEALGILQTFGETSLLDAIYQAAAELKAGEIEQRRGDPAAAIRHYHRFIQLWQDSDAELRPLVVDAQRRIEHLQSLRK